MYEYGVFDHILFVDRVARDITTLQWARLIESIIEITLFFWQIAGIDRSSIVRLLA